MLEEFFKYVSNYDLDIYAVKRKYEHSIRVMNLGIKYARILGYSDSDVELASIIGLLHDIGRFEQYTKYLTFDDLNTFDHADYGVDILFKDDLIKNFTDRVVDYDLIRFAIRNHNKLFIEECNNKRYLKFAKLIRDVDKLDIVYLNGYLGEYKYVANGDYISDKVRECFSLKKSVDNKYILNNNDNLAATFALVYDVNNDIILKEFKQNIYYFYKRIGGINIFKDIYGCVVKYIDERIGNYVR